MLLNFIYMRLWELKESMWFKHAIIYGTCDDHLEAVNVCELERRWLE